VADAAIDAAAAGWLDPANVRVVVVLPPDEPLPFESPDPGVVQAMPAPELFR
jgi:hypothetical protein